MTRSVLAIIVVVSTVLLATVFGVPISAQSPVESAQATIDAWRFSQTLTAQQTRAAREQEQAEQRATAARLGVIQQEQAATRAAISATETSEAKTRTAQVQATATAQAYVQATSQAHDRFTATAEARATVIANANASETVRAEQTAIAHARQTAIAQATVTQAAYISKQLDSELESRRFTTFLSTFAIFSIFATLLTLAAVGLYRENRLSRGTQSPRSEPVTVFVDPDRASADTQFADLDIPFGTAAPLTIITDPELALELYRVFQNAIRRTDQCALPPGN